MMLPNKDLSLVHEGERLDDLEFNDMYIISHKDRYCFTSDAVMLANLVKASAKQTVVDFCAGGGIISLLVAGKTTAKRIIAVELQPEMADMCKRSVELNNMTERIEVLCDNVIGIADKIGRGSADIVMCNPPYYKPSEGASRLNQCMAIARHEIELTLEQMIRSASECLKYGGKFYMVHKATRLAESIMLLGKYKLEPKVLYNIETNNTGEVDTFIIECKKNASTGMLVKNIKHD